MGKKSLEPITESMFYVLLCLHSKNMYGTEMAELVRKITDDRVKLGPGTLYSILSTFETEGVISKFSQEGRRITYQITERGEQLYQDELQRMRKCLWDAQRKLQMNESVRTTATSEDKNTSAVELATI